MWGEERSGEVLRGWQVPLLPVPPSPASSPSQSVSPLTCSLPEFLPTACPEMALLLPLLLISPTACPNCQITCPVRQWPHHWPTCAATSKGTGSLIMRTGSIDEHDDIVQHLPGSRHFLFHQQNMCFAGNWATNGEESNLNSRMAGMSFRRF